VYTVRREAINLLPSSNLSEIVFVNWSVSTENPKNWTWKRLNVFWSKKHLTDRQLANYTYFTKRLLGKNDS
jgi:hypothetical protein